MKTRTARRLWVSIIVVGSVLLLLIVVAAVLQTSGFGTTLFPAAVGDVSSNLSSVRVVDGAAIAQVDVRAPLSAASVGLPSTASTTVGPFDGISLEVDLVGVKGTERIFVDSMRVATNKGRVVSLSTRTSDHGYAFIHAQLESLLVLGLTSQQMANFENNMPNGAGGPDSRFSLLFGEGDALGVPTTVGVTCSGSAGCTVSTTTTLPTG